MSEFIDPDDERKIAEKYFLERYGDTFRTTETAIGWTTGWMKCASIKNEKVDKALRYIDITKNFIPKSVVNELIKILKGE